MALGIITGKTGSITLPGSAAQRIFAVSLTSGTELLDDSAYGGAGYRTRTTGLKDLGGTASAFLTKGIAGTSPFALDGTSGSLVILWDTGCSVTFTAVFGNVAIAGEYAGMNVVTFSFANASDSAPTVVWDTGS